MKDVIWRKDEGVDNGNDKNNTITAMHAFNNTT